MALSAGGKEKNLPGNGETKNNGIQQDEGRPLLPATTPERRRWDVGRGTYPVLERFIQKENPV